MEKGEALIHAATPTYLRCLAGLIVVVYCKHTLTHTHELISVHTPDKSGGTPALSTPNKTWQQENTALTDGMTRSRGVWLCNPTRSSRRLLYFYHSPPKAERWANCVPLESLFIYLLNGATLRTIWGMNSGAEYIGVVHE